MIVNSKIDYCSCCGNYTEILFGIENYDLSQLDLKNYIKYKDIYVYTCRKCGMISTNLTTQDKSLYESVRHTDRFKDIMSYEYLEGYDLELYENHTRSVPANLYDAYAMMYEKSSDKETYLRSLYRSIQLKEVAIEKYQIEFEEDEGDEEEEEILSNLEDLMYENIEEARKSFNDVFLQFEDKNEFLFLMYVENLVGLEDYKNAKDNLNWIIKNYKLSDDLIEYMQNLTNEE